MLQRAGILALAALLHSAEAAAARTTLVGPQPGTFTVGLATITEQYEVYSDDGRVYVSYYIDGGRAAFGFTATRVWDASNGGCGDLINNVPIGPPHGGADHVLRVAACSTLGANGAVRVSMTHYVREILGPGDVSDHEEVTPIVLSDGEYSVGAAETLGAVAQSPTAPPAPATAPVITAAVVAVPVSSAPSLADFTTLAAQSVYDGTIDLGDGYSLQHVNDWYDIAGIRHFQFDIYGPLGSLRAATYESPGSNSWQGHIGVLRVDDRTLYLAFSDWRNGQADLHYAWR